jgi:hypothetical protein
MTYDAPYRRLYIFGADGVDIVSQEDPNHYRSIQHVDTFGGKTSVYVTSLKRFYLVHTKGEMAHEAALQLFAVSHHQPSGYPYWLGNLCTSFVHAPIG